MADEIRALALAGMLGTGFHESSFERALSWEPDFIGCDAGSTDSGPGSLGTGVPAQPRQGIKRDLRIGLLAALQRRIPLLVGSAGSGAGGANLAAVVEAVIGAVYLDQGPEAARRMILKLLDPEIERAELRGHAPMDPKSHLQEVVQARHEPLPQYRVVGERGPDHQRTFTVEVVLEDQVAGVGVARRKVDAERKAAAKALKALAASTAACKE